MPNSSDGDIWRKSGPRRSDSQPVSPGLLNPRHDKKQNAWHLGAIEVDDASKRAGKLPFSFPSPVSMPGIQIPIILKTQWAAADPRNTASVGGGPGAYQVTFV